MGRGPAGHVEEILDRQRDAVERRQVLGRGGPYDRIGCVGRGFADIVVGPVAERAEPGVELVHPLEVAVGHLDRAHLLAAYGRGELDGRHERVNRGAHHELSFLVRVYAVSVVACRGCVLDECRAGARSLAVARSMATCDLASGLVTLRLCGTSPPRHGPAGWRGSAWPDSALGQGTSSTFRRSVPGCHGGHQPRRRAARRRRQRSAEARQPRRGPGARPRRCSRPAWWPSSTRCSKAASSAGRRGRGC